MSELDMTRRTSLWNRRSHSLCSASIVSVLMPMVAIGAGPASILEVRKCSSCSLKSTLPYSALENQIILQNAIERDTAVFAYVHNETETASTQLVNITAACNFLEFSIDITYALTQHFYRTWWK